MPGGEYILNYGSLVKVFDLVGKWDIVALALLIKKYHSSVLSETKFMGPVGLLSN